MTFNELAIPGNFALFQTFWALGQYVPGNAFKASFTLLDPRLFGLYAAICAWWPYKHPASAREAAYLRKNAVACVLSFVVAMAIVAAIKVGVSAARPAAALTGFSARMTEGDPYGFPSGHAALAMVIAYVAWRSVGIGGRMGLVLLVVWIMLARCMAGLHFPVDVIAGAAIGWTGCFIVSLIANRHMRDGKLSP